MLLVLVACKGKKKASLSGDDPIEVSDFIDAFKPLEVPYLLSDSVTLSKKAGDSLWISYSVFNQFVPDTVLGKIYGKEKKLKIYPLGKVSQEENYLFAKAVAGNKINAFVICFDKKNKYITAMPAIIPDANPATRQYFNIDGKSTITKRTTRKNPNGITTEAKDVYILNPPTKSFLLIQTVNPDARMVEVINPIDTLPRKNKFSGDYGKDLKNIVSIRDNKKQGRMAFFIHLEKNNGDCIAELKGEANFVSANHATYHAGGPCTIEFSFTSSSVTISEQSCGAYRGMDCLFEGSYVKKKEPKKPKKKK